MDEKILLGSGRTSFDGIIIVMITIHSSAEMQAFGAKLGAGLKGGEIIELIGDVGAGKTTLTKGIASGMGIDEDVQSPTFTISRVYDAPNNLHLAHYDFYRLHDAGIMADELHETAADPTTVTIIEWAEIVSGVLPADRLTIRLTSPSEDTRQIQMQAGGPKSTTILEQLT